MVCPTCIAVPLAFGGGMNSKKNKWIMYLSILSLVILIGYYVYLRNNGDTCSDCTSNKNIWFIIAFSIILYVLIKFYK